MALVTQLSPTPLSSLTPERARQEFETSGGLAGGEGAVVSSVERRSIDGVPCQIITPTSTDVGPLPVLIWIHGGGWVIGSAALAEHTARDLASGAGCMVVNVDYGLAPEHPFPVAIDQAVTVARWVRAHASELGGDPGRIAVGGDSAGGNLAAVVAQEVPGLIHQLLVYPVTDATRSHPSYRSMGEGYLLTADAMEWFINHYLGQASPSDPRVSPLLAHESSLAQGPPAHVISAGYDPLRDECEAYAHSLGDAGVPVELQRYEGQMHGFFSMSALIPEGAEAVAEAARGLRQAFGLSGSEPDRHISVAGPG